MCVCVCTFPLPAQLMCVFVCASLCAWAGGLYLQQLMRADFFHSLSLPLVPSLLLSLIFFFVFRLARKSKYFTLSTSLLRAALCQWVCLYVAACLSSVYVCVCGSFSFAYFFAVLFYWLVGFCGLYVTYMETFDALAWWVLQLYLYLCNATFTNFAIIYLYSY